MAQPLTVLFMPESAYGPTNNCIGIGDVLRTRRPSGRVRRRGVVGRPARAARVRRGSRRPRAAARARCRRRSPGRRPVLEGLHPRHRAGVPQADDRAARDVHAADVAGADRRRAVLRAAAPRDHRPPAAGRDRRGQRRRVPRARDRRRPFVRIVLVQPARDPGGSDAAGDPAGLLRSAGGRPERVGARSARSTTGPTARRGRRSTPGAASRATRAAARARVHPRLARPQPLRLPAGRRLHRSPAARPRRGTGSTRRSGRPTAPSSCPPSWPTGRPARRSSTCRSARSAAPTST